MSEYKITEREASYAKSGAWIPASVQVQVIVHGRHLAFHTFKSREAADVWLARRA